MNLLYFDLIWGFVVDYMHAILLGVAKLHMEYLFDSTKKKCWIDMTENISLKDLTNTIDIRLLSIQPPTGITRTPRSIENCCKWKASEWRSWLLFYCVPCLRFAERKIFDSFSYALPSNLHSPSTICISR